MLENEYQTQLSLRGSDKVSISMVSNFETDEPMLSSETWNSISRDLATGARAFALGAAIAAGVGQLEVVGPAAATAAIASEASKLAAQMAAATRAQEEEAAKAKAEAAAKAKAEYEAQMRGIERGVRDAMDRVSRGDYRDPPTRERADTISRMC